MVSRSAKILLVEDNIGDVDLLRAILEDPGPGDYHLTCVERVKEGLGKLQEDAFDIILLDLSLPDSQGVETLVTMVNAAGQVPVVVLTGADNEDTAAEVVRRGAQDYLVKGQIDRPNLTRAIRYAIERKRSQEEIYFLAHHDSLTGLPNRTLMLDRLSQAIAHARRTGQMLALHFIDLDRFKEVNDSLGHAAGDYLLRGVAERLKSATRASDTVARLGGDEFVVIHEHLDDPRDAAYLADRFVEVLVPPFRIDGRDIFTTATVGIAVYPNDAAHPEELLKMADLALYTAKEKALGRYNFYNPEMSANLEGRRALEADLRHAISDDHFLLHYQPKVRLDDGRVVGAEALVRWRRHGGELIAPDQFIPVAETTGLIKQLGRWVVGQAVRDIGSARRTLDRQLSIAVNLSATQFDDTELVPCIVESSRESGVPGDAVEFEITESAIPSDERRAHHLLTQLRDLGSHLAIDDFGTAYASLIYLHRYPFSQIKIDRAFVSAIGKDENAKAIVRAIIHLGKGLNMDVIAEGIETREQFEFVRSEGCAYGQGYFFSRPLPIDELLAFLKLKQQPSLPIARSG